MIGAGSAFKVITEFRFEAGAAIAQTQQLQGAVENLSGAANDALLTFQSLGFSLATQFGVGAGGLLGILYTAIKASDKFKESQLALANVIADYSVPFEQRMQLAKKAMEDINKLAGEFALPAEDLLHITKVLGPMLKQKGLAGENFSTAIDMGRNLLKAAPALGVDANLVQGQFIRMVEGQASGGDTLFNRLSGDTKEMQKFLGNAKAFNKLDTAQRVGTMRRALAEFTKDGKILEENVKTLSGQFRLLHNNLRGVGSILRPVGDAAGKPVVESLMTVNDYLKMEGKEIATHFGSALEAFFTAPKTIIASLVQLGKLAVNMSSAGKIVGAVGAALALQETLSFLGIRDVPVLTKALALLRAMVVALERDLISATMRRAATVSIFSNFLGSFLGHGIANALFKAFMHINKAVIFVSRVFMPMLLLLMAFQFLARSVAHAKMLAYEKFFKDFLPRAAASLAIFAKILGIFVEGIDVLARGMGHVLDPTKFLGFIDVLEILASVMEWLADAATLFMMGFQGLFNAIIQLAIEFAKVQSGDWYNVRMRNVTDAWDDGMLTMFEKIKGKIDGGEAVANTNQYIDTININNDFKEKADPDRVAFTVKQQIIKAATNRTQSRGNSQKAMMVGN